MAGESTSELFASLYRARQVYDEASAVAALKALTSKFRDSVFRSEASTDDLQFLVDTLRESSGGAMSKGVPSTVELCTECVRCIRNACVQCARNQDAVASDELVQTVQTLMKYNLEKHDMEEVERLLLRCCVQCLNNVASGHAGGQLLIWRHILGPLLPSMVGVQDGKVPQYTCMLLQTCLSNPECAAKFEDSPKAAQVMESVLSLCFLETDHDFSLLFVQMMLRLPTLISTIFAKLSLPSQLVLLEIANACMADESDAHDQRISEGTLKCFADKFAGMGHHILSLAMKDSASNQTPRLVTSLLELFCGASANVALQPLVQGMESVLETSLELLDMVEQVGRSSDNAFTVSQDFDGMTGDGAGSEAPGYGFKRSLVQLVGNLCFRNRLNQDKVRELHGIPSILQQCNVDSRNAFINQWAILAIRNLCEGNKENQDYIASMKNQGAADSEVLARLGLEAVLRDDGQVYLKNTKQK